MPKVLAQSNLPNSAAVVVSSETIVLRDPNNRILEKYTSEEQKQLSLKSYGIKPATLLSPGDNKTKPTPPPPVPTEPFSYPDGTSLLSVIINPPYNVSAITESIRAGNDINDRADAYLGEPTDESFRVSSLNSLFCSSLIEVEEGMKISFNGFAHANTRASVIFFDEHQDPLPPSQCLYVDVADNFIIPAGVKYMRFQITTLAPTTSLIGGYNTTFFGFTNNINQNLEENG